MGGGQLLDAVQLLTTSVPFWAAAAGAAGAAAGLPLPPTLAALAPTLAAAHLPLALMTAGASWKAEAALPPRHQLRDAAAVLAVRLLPGLLAGAAATLAVPMALLPLILVAVLMMTGGLPSRTDCRDWASLSYCGGRCHA